MPELTSVAQSAAAVLLVPPVNLALLALAAVLLGWRRLAAALLALLALLALPAVSGTLLAGLESGLPGAPAGAVPAAIIILGGDVVDIAGAADTIDVGSLTLERLRAGAALSRATHLPVLATGGVIEAGQPPVAELMARSLVADFAITPRWIEPAARDTWENASRSAAMLRRDGISTVYVVTHAWHMRRALIAFAASGLTVVPAPLPLDRPPDFSARDFVPRVSSWRRGYYALHEWIGGAWYAWVRGGGGG